MDGIVYLVLILIALELFEAYWQYSDTMAGLLANGYYYYQKSIFLLFLMHPSLYFVLFLVFFTDTLNGWIVAILLFKSIDLFLKISLMRSLFVYGDLPQEIRDIIEEPLSPWLFTMGLGIYPPLLYYALG
ncbi:hypothetical protein MNB_SV-6-1580 [hydrothermal vent metagenome]|uniref:Uncharacterized protein n=1 Tax=hydrothermal vent metagenome TaxID=652676 RepID=A0A1W1BBG3_9ZZZZ